MKRPTLSLRGPNPSLRGGPFPEMKVLIHELRELWMGKGSKIYQRATREACYIPEGPTLPKMAHFRSEIAHTMTEHTCCRLELALRAHFLPDNSHLRKEELQFGVEGPTHGVSWGLMGPITHSQCNWVTYHAYMSESPGLWVFND